MKIKLAQSTRIFIAAIALVLCFSVVLMSACGSKKVEAGDYTATVTYDKEYVSAGGPGPAPGGPTATQYWGVKVTIYVDEDGVIWTIDASAPDADHAFTNQFTWTVSGSKFTAQFSGEWTVSDFAKINVGVDADGFPLTPGDGSSVTHPSKDIMVLHDAEATCGVVILCIQKIIAENNLA